MTRVLELLQELNARFGSLAATAEEGHQTWLLAQELRDIMPGWEVEIASRPRLAR